ncbi:GNAT family N-acetyltransferase [Phyllobacterium sp. P30BS-XVII]|uniref:GNAT family N-acetyltransferase n=1 Tax=Phyllobacterium sp. P30BS-XVII TaxID=2587046 RepID=UPI0015F9112B|nr:GNAT family N-acetyltransferase [Phyllobacterium sp. P30BS-XVII]MBA8901121.1 ribosomal-protein-alanine N-acetyltransferase [Phyllobacterium sp. P30BS-XVII]
MTHQLNGCPTLLTPRLRLRQFESRDEKGLHACLGNEKLTQYWDFSACETIEETRRWLRVLAKTTSPYETMAWAVADRTTDQCIGMVNYHHREARNHRLEIGYILRTEWQGRGLMGEAVQALVNHCSENLKIHRISAIIHPDNAASIKLVERLGFEYEGGPMRDYWRVGTTYMSPMLYSLIVS